MFKSYCEDFQKFRNQYKAIVIVNLISFLHGAASGWLSPSARILQSSDSYLESGQITVEELSWIGGLLCLGGLCGNSIFSILAGRFGRKFALIVLGLPNLSFWLLLIFSKYVMHLYLARFFAGFTGGGLFVVIPVFVADIADPKVRGKLNGFMSLVISIGVLSGFILVEVLPLNYIAYILCGGPIIYILCVSKLPETSHFLLISGKFEEAKESLWFYKSYDYQRTVDTKLMFEKDVSEMQLVLQRREKEATGITRDDFSECYNGSCS